MSAKVPASLKPIAHYVKIANDNSSRDPVVYYWCLYYAVQNAMQLDKSSPDARQYLTGLLGTLEHVKKQLATTETVQNEIVAQAHLESFALKLFNFADAKEKAGDVDKNVVHAFYTAGHVMDVLSLFGEIDEHIAATKKYAKWKSTQIFACLRDGTPYVPSTQQEQHDGVEDSFSGMNIGGGGVGGGGGAAPSVPEHNYDAFGQPHHGGGSLPPPSPAHGSASFHSLPPQPPAPARPAPPAQPTYYETPTPAARSNYDQGPSVQPAAAPSYAQPSVLDFQEARKFAKYAISAMDYEDTPSVIDNLKKALACIQK